MNNLFLRAAALAVLATATALSAQYPYRAIDLGPVPGQDPRAGVGGQRLDPSGQFACGTSVWEPYVWSRSGGMVALSKLPNYLNGEAFDVDSGGRVVGSCGLLTSGATPIVAVLWDALGNPTPLGNLGGSWSRALEVNDSGLVVGTAERGSGPHVFTWTAAGGMVDFTPNAASAAVYDLNERGQMLLSIDGALWRYTPGQALLPLGSMHVYAMNELGQVAGKDQTTSKFARYTDGIGWEMIGANSPVQMREIGGINAFGQIVGTQFILQNPSPPSYEKRGQLFTDGLGLVRLDGLIDPVQQVRIYWAEDIDDAGNILASGSIGSNNRALLLEPQFVHTYGNACSGGDGRQPKVSVAGVPASGQSIAFLAAGGVPSGFALLLLSPATANLPLPGGCTILVDLQQVISVVLPLNPVGQGSRTLRVPAGVGGASIHAQLATIDPGAANGAFALSWGVTIDLQ